ncbi:uncharacterized protein LOC142775903 isoform X2 [Rhipicephalus microplus]|uniref:uncharacterized protein LOC142775903 isoform X2 n=1 Tax=Rhipicephalus microplus TaxID=6941 RepID=UPI003F6C9CDB
MSVRKRKRAGRGENYGRHNRLLLPGSGVCGMGTIPVCAVGPILHLTLVRSVSCGGTLFADIFDELSAQDQWIDSFRGLRLRH